jgi:CheY-like chemotaxis protein
VECVPVTQILIVDDDAAIREAFSRTLRHAGFEVTAVENGVAALEEIAQRNFEVVVCDYSMPRLGGQGFYEQIEERFPAVAARVVFVTAHADDPRIQAFLDHTGQPVLQIPVDIQTLVSEVQLIATRVRGRPSSPNYGL